jgi:hypothetical protein
VHFVRYGNDSCGRSLGESGITLGTQQWFVTLKTQAMKNRKATQRARPVNSSLSPGFAED